MILLEDRQKTAQWVEQACREGARLKSACELAGIDARTLQRWRSGAGLSHGDGRPHAAKPPPSHALSAQEREQILQIANEPRFAELPPARIVPTLADEGTYIASESSFSRVLRAHGQGQPVRVKVVAAFSYAADAAIPSAPSAALMTASFSGLRVTAAMGCQLRV